MYGMYSTVVPLYLVVLQLKLEELVGTRGHKLCELPQVANRRVIELVHLWHMMKQ